MPDEWHHLAFSWDSDAENGKEGLIYLDGFEVEYDQKFGPDLTGKWINGAITSNGLFYLGRDPKPPYNSNKKEVENRYLLGALDELVIFNDVINSTQLARIRQDTVSAHLEQLDSKIEAYWSFDSLEPEAYDLLDLTEKVTLKLGRGWEGHALLVPSSALVTNNIFIKMTFKVITSLRMTT